MNGLRKDIVLTRVSKAYGGQIVLQELDLTIPGGKITAVMGPSGLGKTTLLKILLGLEDCEGSVDGLDGRKVSTVFQESRLLPWLTAEKNVEIVSGLSEGQTVFYEYYLPKEDETFPFGLPGQPTFPGNRQK